MACDGSRQLDSTLAFRGSNRSDQVPIRGARASRRLGGSYRASRASRRHEPDAGRGPRGPDSNGITEIVTRTFRGGRGLRCCRLADVCLVGVCSVSPSRTRPGRCPSAGGTKLAQHDAVHCALGMASSKPRWIHNERSRADPISVQPYVQPRNQFCLHRRSSSRCGRSDASIPARRCNRRPMDKDDWRQGPACQSS